MATLPAEPSITSMVEAALRDPAWDFRTAEGIAEEQGLPVDAVREALRHVPGVRKSLVPDRRGCSCYTLRPIDRKEILAGIRLFFSKPLD